VDNPMARRLSGPELSVPAGSVENGGCSGTRPRHAEPLTSGIGAIARCGAAERGW